MKKLITTCISLVLVLQMTFAAVAFPNLGTAILRTTVGLGNAFFALIPPLRMFKSSDALFASTDSFSFVGSLLQFCYGGKFYSADFLYSLVKLLGAAERNIAGQIIKDRETTLGENRDYYAEKMKQLAEAKALEEKAIETKKAQQAKQAKIDELKKAALLKEQEFDKLKEDALTAVDETALNYFCDTNQFEKSGAATTKTAASDSSVPTAAEDKYQAENDSELAKEDELRQEKEARLMKEKEAMLLKEKERSGQ